ncbi:response regulator [Pontibacter chitinilyticus]|uniref:response regulator n=1 Tax=Pontibacter chitinilyticus TaxID=2674989 RepID=UPI003218E8C3
MNRLKHILIIDDDQINNLFSQIVLEDANISDLISVCQSVPEALEFLYNITSNSDTLFPDMILLDISMPTLDGFDFLDSYYALGYHTRYQTFISMFTTFKEQEFRVRLEQYEVVVGFINKPLSMPALQSILAIKAGSNPENNLP